MQRVGKAIAVGVGGIFLFVLIAALWGIRDLQRYRDMSPDERKAEQAAHEARSAAEREATAALNLRQHRDGQHCLTYFGGQHSQLVTDLLRDLREPDSFEHIETVILPVNAQGYHELTMRYRARNGFGGMNVATIRADVANSDCSYRITDAS